LARAAAKVADVLRWIFRNRVENEFLVRGAPPFVFPVPPQCALRRGAHFSRRLRDVSLELQFFRNILFARHLVSPANQLAALNINPYLSFSCWYHGSIFCRSPAFTYCGSGRTHIGQVSTVHFCPRQSACSFNNTFKRRVDSPQLMFFTAHSRAWKCPLRSKKSVNSTSIRSSFRKTPVFSLMNAAEPT